MPVSSQGFEPKTLVRRGDRKTVTFGIGTDESSTPGSSKLPNRKNTLCRWHLCVILVVVIVITSYTTNKIVYIATCTPLQKGHIQMCIHICSVSYQIYDWGVSIMAKETHASNYFHDSLIQSKLPATHSTTALLRLSTLRRLLCRIVVAARGAIHARFSSSDVGKYRRISAKLSVVEVQFYGLTWNRSPTIRTRLRLALSE